MLTLVAATDEEYINRRKRNTMESLDMLDRSHFVFKLEREGKISTFQRIIHVSHYFLILLAVLFCVRRGSFLVSLWRDNI